MARHHEVTLSELSRMAVVIRAACGFVRRRRDDFARDQRIDRFVVKRAIIGEQTQGDRALPQQFAHRQRMPRGIFRIGHILVLGDFIGQRRRGYRRIVDAQFHVMGSRGRCIVVQRLRTI